ncbi:MAG: flavin reductase family protein, partial [Myxococcales bacterium]|nr:flavin reductase family protein [Myxococcales bacterium]
MSLEQGFKDALACWASGVCVVTTKSADGLMYGLTVSSFSSLSLDPPLILVCIDNRNRFPGM